MHSRACIMVTDRHLFSEGNDEYDPCGTVVSNRRYQALQASTKHKGMFSYGDTTIKVNYYI
jgi:hypothetical protein